MNGDMLHMTPRGRCRVLDFLRSCVSSPRNAMLTTAVIALALSTFPALVHWLLLDAVWSGTSAKDCVGHDAACWIFIRAHAGQLLYGSYPAGQRWRLAAAAVIGIATAVAVGSSTHRLSVLSIGLMLIAGSVAVGILIVGGIAGLPFVATSLWGGVLLTVVIAAWTIVTALPLGLLLASARQSELPIISAIAGAFIDTVRGLPLVGLLFLVIVMFPLCSAWLRNRQTGAGAACFHVVQRGQFRGSISRWTASHSSQPDRGRLQSRTAEMARDSSDCGAASDFGFDTRGDQYLHIDREGNDHCAHSRPV